MDTVDLPGTGRTTSRIGFGGTALMTSLDETRSLRLLDAAYDAGIRHYDVAPIYGIGDAERCLGRFLRRHDDVTVATKFGVPVGRRRPGMGVARALARGPVGALAKQARGMLGGGGGGGGAWEAPAEPLTLDWARDSFATSVANLGVERIDLYLLHEAELGRLTDPALLPWLRSEVDGRRIGAFGIATDRHAADALLAARPEYCDLVQADWSLLEPGAVPEGPFPVLFRSVGFVLPRVQHRLDAVTGLPKGLLMDLARNPTLLGDVLMRSAARQAAGGIMLFSSKDEDRIRRNVIAADSAPLDPYVDELRAFLATAPAAA